MAFYPRAAIVKWKSEFDGQALETQVTFSPTSPENWSSAMLEPIANTLYLHIGDDINAPQANAGFGAFLNDWLPTAVRQQSCEIYLMQGGFSSLFFRKTFPMNIDGQRTATGGLLPTFNAVGFSSATTEYQKKPSDFRLYGLFETDNSGQEIIGVAATTALDNIKDSLNREYADLEVEFFDEGVVQLYSSNWYTSVVTRLKITNPEDPTDVDYVLPSQPGDPVFATRVTNWGWSPSVTSQVTRKRRKNNA